MPLRLFGLCFAMLLSLSVSPVLAGDFDWLKSLSLEAKMNESGFRSRLALRFNIGDAKIKAVINDVGGHSDAYMVLRLAEMSHRPVDQVVTSYRQYKDKGWGRLAKSLGIKPGSAEFHALKNGHDLNGSGKNQKNKSTGNKDNGKNKNKNKKFH